MAIKGYKPIALEPWRARLAGYGYLLVVILPHRHGGVELMFVPSQNGARPRGGGEQSHLFNSIDDAERAIDRVRKKMASPIDLEPWRKKVAEDLVSRPKGGKIKTPYISPHKWVVEMMSTAYDLPTEVHLLTDKEILEYCVRHGG